MIFSARLFVAKATTFKAPVTFSIDGGLPLLKRIAIYTPTAAIAADKIGVLIRNRGTQIFPAPGSYCDTSATLAGRGHFGPVTVAEIPPWMEFDADLLGAPYAIDVSVYNEDAATDALILALFDFRTRPVMPGYVVSLADALALVRTPQAE